MESSRQRLVISNLDFAAPRPYLLLALSKKSAFEKTASSVLVLISLMKFEQPHGVLGTDLASLTRLFRESGFF